MKPSFRSLGQVLERALAGTALEEGVRDQEALDHWPLVVGEENARHSRAVGVKDGVLLVQVEGSAWAQELTLLKPQIVRDLNQALGARRVRDIRFRSGSVDPS